MGHPRSTAVVELDPLGHRLQYVRLILDRLLPTERLLPDLAPSGGFSGVRRAPRVRRGRRRRPGQRRSRRGDLRGVVDGDRARGRPPRGPDGDKAVRPLLRTLMRGALTWSRPRRPHVTVLLMRTALPGGPEAATLGMALKPALVAGLRRLTRGTRSLPHRRVRCRHPPDGVSGVRPVRDPVAPRLEVVRERRSMRGCGSASSG